MPEQPRCLFNVFWATVDEVAGQGNDVRILSLGPGDCIFQIPCGDVGATVEIAQLSDLHPVECCR